MPRMDHQHLKSGALCQTCHMAVSLYDLTDHIFGQRPHFHAVRPCRIRRSPLVHGLLSGFVRHISAGIHAGMGQLQGRDRAVPADRVSRISRCCERIQDTLIEVIGMGTVCRRMHHQFRDRDSSSSAFCPQLIKSS